MNIAAIIPARGGSKGIPHKNIVDLGGLPLLGWSIRVAQQTPLIDKIYVSTDDLEIANVAKNLGAEVPFLRPSSLALDNSKTVDSIADFLTKLKNSNICPDIVVLLQPTQPFRSSNTVTKAIKLFMTRNAGVLTVSPATEHPILLRSLNFENFQLTQILPNVSSTVRRQDFNKIYKVNGAVYVNSSSDYFERASLNDNPFAVLTSKIEGVDIDEPEDLEYAKWLLSRELVHLP